MRERELPKRSVYVRQLKAKRSRNRRSVTSTDFDNVEFLGTLAGAALMGALASLEWDEE